MCPVSSKVSYAPHPLSTWRLAMSIGKLGVVAQPSRVAPFLVSGAVQSLAPGSVTQVPPVPDCDEFEQIVPSSGVNDNSKVCDWESEELGEVGTTGESTGVITRYPWAPVLRLLSLMPLMHATPYGAVDTTVDNPALIEPPPPPPLMGEP